MTVIASISFDILSELTATLRRMEMCKLHTPFWCELCDISEINFVALN